MKKAAFLLAGVLVLFLVCYGGAQLLSPSEPKYQEESFFLGRIYDVERRLLAESQKAEGLLLIPQAFEVTPKNLHVLQKLTGKDKATLTLLLSTRNSPFFLPLVSRDVPPLGGILKKEYSLRRYPYEDLFTPVLGKESDLGGLELYYQQLLAKPQSFLRTALKVEFQEALKRDLLYTLRRLRASAGAAAVLDVDSGRVKALVAQGDLSLFLAPEIELSWVKEPFEKGYYDSMYESLHDFLRALGFGEPTGIDVPGEVPGLLPASVESFEEVKGSLVQIIRALAALSTGKLLSPKLALEAGFSEEGEYVISVERRDLEDLVPLEKGGVWWYGGSRKEGRFVLVGLWPRKNPRLAFGLLVKGVKVWGLPCYYTRFIPTSVKRFASRGISHRRPQEQLVSQKTSGLQKMPDVRGLTLKAALEKLNPLGIEVHFSGFGVTVKQWPPPGTPLTKISECRLVLR